MENFLMVYFFYYYNPLIIFIQSKEIINYINEEINPLFIKNEYLLKKNYNKKESIVKLKITIIKN